MRWFGPALAVASVAGVAAGVLSPIGASDALAASLALASVALLVARPRLARALVLACAAALMIARGAAARDAALASPLEAWFEAHAAGARLDEPVPIRARLLDDAQETEFGVRLRLGVLAVREDGEWHATRGTVQVHVSGQAASAARETWTDGRLVQAPVLLRAPPVLLNPGGASERWQRLQRPFDLAGTVKSAALVEVERGVWWREGGAAARRYVRRAAARALDPYSPQTTAVVVAILIGDRAGLDRAVVDRLQAAGTYHVVAISGGNVALVTALCYGLVRLVIRSARTTAMVAITVVAGYGGIVTAQPSVTRAVIAAIVYLAIGAVGLAPGAVHVIALVALIVAIADPLAVVDVGAWLSFGATLAIVVGMPRASAIIARVAPGGWSSLIVRVALGLLAATAAAEIALLPIAALVFGRVGVAGLAVNFVAIPAMAVVQVAGAAAVGAVAVSSGAASAFAAIAHVAARVLVDSARLVDWIPALSWRVPPASPWWALSYYAALAVALWVGRRARLRRAGVAVALASAIALSLTPGVISFAGPPAGRLRVTMIDVGQGESILIQFPDRHSLLVDAGGAASDIGARAIVPALWASGVRRLDWLLVTHPDLDHVVGAEDVIRAVAPREVWEGVPVEPDRARRALIDAAAAAGSVRRELRAGDRLEIGGVSVDVLHPHTPDWERPRVRNNDSVVLRVTFGHVEMLFTGDAAEEYESQPLPPRDPASVRVLKVAHHGSRTSSAEPFLTAFRPDVALISAGRGNLFSHPAAAVLERYARLGAFVFRTDVDGAIVLESDGRGVEVTTARGRSLGVRAWIETWTASAPAAPSLPAARPPPSPRAMRRAGRGRRRRACVRPPRSAA